MREKILSLELGRIHTKIWDNKSLLLNKVDEGNHIYLNGELIEFTGRNSIAVQGAANFLFLDGKGRINSSRIEIKGSRSIVYVGENFDFDGNKILISGDDVLISIGKNFRANFGTEILAKENGSEIEIGDDCLFSTHIGIRTSDNHGIFNLNSRERINFSKDIEILDRVWIGEDAKILKGVRVGPDAVVGAAAIVTKDVPPFTVVAGNPAKIIKRNIFWYKHFDLLK